jgi:tetratricopeptide (TPR) repeat protein
MVDVAFCRAISVQFLVARAVAVWSASFGPRCLDSDVDFQCGKFPRSSPEVVQSQILRSVTCRGLSPVCPRFNMAERTNTIEVETVRFGSVSPRRARQLQGCATKCRRSSTCERERLEDITVALRVATIQYDLNHNHSEPAQIELEQLISDLKSPDPHSKALEYLAEFTSASAQSLTGSFDDARANYRKISQSQSNFVTSDWKYTARLGLANTYFYAQDFAGAASEYERLKSDIEKENPADSVHTVNLTINLMNAMGRNNELDKAIEIGLSGLRNLDGVESNNPKSYFSLVQNLMICCLLREHKGDIDTAVDLYRKAIKKVPSYPDPSGESTYIIALMCENENSDQLLPEFRRLTKQMTSESELLVGLYDLKLGRSAEAFSAFRDSMNLPVHLFSSEQDILKAVRQDAAESGWGEIPLVKHLFDSAGKPKP